MFWTKKCILFQLIETRLCFIKTKSQMLNRQTVNWERCWNQSNKQFVDVKTKNWWNNYLYVKTAVINFKLVNNQMKSNWNWVEIQLLMAKTDVPCKLRIALMREIRRGLKLLFRYRSRCPHQKQCCTFGRHCNRYHHCIRKYCIRRTKGCRQKCSSNCLPNYIPFHSCRNHH